jgi:hypothetical protein
VNILIDIVKHSPNLKWLHIEFDHEGHIMGLQTCEHSH